jgi:hypothetical protein
MPTTPNRFRALLAALSLGVVGVAGCTAQDEADQAPSPQGEVDDAGAEQRPPEAIVEDPGGERDARPGGEADDLGDIYDDEGERNGGGGGGGADPDMGGELGDVQGDDDDGG